MKKLYFLLFFVFSFVANAQIVNIPDANFKAKLIQLGVDTNNDTEIQVSEAEAVSALNFTFADITDLTGIEAFVNLISLDITGNYIVSLDISNNVNLNTLYCDYNNLTGLDVSNNVNLTNLWCDQNQLTSLDFSNNVNLTNLSCDSNNLTGLDVSGCVNLNDLSCIHNALTSLDISNNVNLSALNCSYNDLISLDASNNVNLELLDCTNNKITSLNIKNNSIYMPNLFFDNNPFLQYICADELELSMVQQKINDYSYNTTCHVNSYCTFTPGGSFYEITGNTKFDFNNNGCDTGDLNYTYLNFSITDGLTTGSMIVNSTGYYYIPVQAGSHTVTPVLENPTYFTISPASFTVDFPTQASPFTQDFCVTANGVHSNVEIVVVPTTPARPGFEAHYRIIYKNIGNQVENGEVAFKYFDDVLDYVSSSVAFDSQTFYNLETTLHWNYTNLMPFETRVIDITLNVNSPMETPAVNIGDILSIYSAITITNTDEDLSNNSSGLRQVVVGSYDPNDKTCLEGETVDVSMVGEYVHYVIRFENTGTYPAQNIVVKDMIDVTKFDVSTLVPLHGSHEFYTRIKDNKVEFIFENINLDFNDATNDGYVAFKIKTLPTLTVGETFSNDANIYFDYNFPITTNAYTTTINNVLNNQDFAFENEFTLYPNPTKDILNISSKNQTEIQSVEIYNIVGQVVLAIPNTTKTIDVSNLENGTYFVKVNTQQGSTTSKFIKE